MKKSFNKEYYLNIISYLWKYYLHCFENEAGSILTKINFL